MRRLQGRSRSERRRDRRAGTGKRLRGRGRRAAGPSTDRCEDDPAQGLPGAQVVPTSGPTSSPSLAVVTEPFLSFSVVTSSFGQLRGGDGRRCRVCWCRRRRWRSPSRSPRCCRSSTGDRVVGQFEPMILPGESPECRPRPLASFEPRLRRPELEAGHGFLAQSSCVVTAPSLELLGPDAVLRQAGRDGDAAEGDEQRQAAITFE